MWFLHCETNHILRDEQPFSHIVWGIREAGTERRGIDQAKGVFVRDGQRVRVAREGHHKDGKVPAQIEDARVKRLGRIQ